MAPRQTRQQKQRQQKPAAVAASGASGAAASLTCDVCGRGFSRPSHYDRHYRTHLPPEGRLALPCARCGKVFGRNDVLLRHLRTAHGVDPGPQPRAAQKSCYRCVQLRRKCDRAQPCRLCAAVGALCQYAAGASRKDVQQPPQQPQPQPLPPSQTDPSPASHTSPPVLAYAPVHLSRDDVQHDASPPFAPVPPLFHGGVHPAVATYPHHAEYDTGIPPSTDSQPPFLPGGSPAFSDDYYLAATDASAFVPSSLSTVCQLDFRTAGLDWLDFDVPDFFSADDSSIGLEMDPALGAAPPPSAPQLLAAEPAPSQPQPQAHAQAPAERPSSAMVPDGGPSPILPWPFDDTPHDATQHEAAPRRFSLPPLREVLQNTLMQSTDPAPPHRSVLANLVVLMSDPRLPAALEEGEGTGGSVDATASAEAAAAAAAAVTSTPGMAHAANLLKRLVDTYVAKFQPILPLLHVPTWDLATCPPVLVSAMACVGSMLSEDARLASLTCSISDICLPMIAWLGSSDSANYRDIGYLSALCVHQIYSLGSGNRQLYQNADRSRGILVGGLRGMGCLTTARLNLDEDETPPSSSHTPFPVSLASSSASTSGITSPKDPLHAQWLAWIARERETRTAWSSFEYDCSLCTLTGRRGAVDLSELPSRLPCAETLWDAPSATAWAALRTRLHADALGVSVARVLKEALQDPACTAAAASTASPPTPAVSFWGRRLCAQVVGRLLWDLKQLETLSTAAYFGMPSLSTAQAANKARLLRALDNLLLSMDQPTTVGDLISYNIASLIGHYSHLYTAHDVLDTILYIVRNTVAAPAAKHHRGIAMARRRLVATLARDPPEARRLVYHAAQIVAVANDYLVSSPCEILRLFMGYVFLIVFAAYCPSRHRFVDAVDTATAAGPPLQLDVPSHRIASTSDVDRWIAHGGPAALGSGANIFAPGGALAISRDAQALFHRLSCWGLADKFVKILQSFESTALA